VKSRLTVPATSGQVNHAESSCNFGAAFGFHPPKKRVKPRRDPSRIDAQTNHALAQQSSDPAAANALWASIDRRLADAAPAHPLFNRTYLTLVSNRVGNVQQHPLWGPLYDQLWVK
jgi:hypothetical protein